MGAMVSGRARRGAGLRARITVVMLAAALFLSTALAVGLLVPELTESGLKKKNGTVVDVGNASQGYIQVKHKASKKRLKLRISCGDETYTYDLNQDGEFEVFPLQMGSGSYTVRVFEQVRGTQYSGVSAISFSAQLEDEYLPYLYPSQYVRFDAQSEAVAMSQTLCEGLTDDAEKAQAIRAFITGKFMYDYMKVVMIENATAYLPDVDVTLQERKGLCFDFAALFCCMLRAQGIPTKLVIGYADRTYHAWNQAYLNGEWRLFDTTSEITNTTVRQYTPERHY